MVGSCDLLTKANWDPKPITQASTVSVSVELHGGSSEQPVALSLLLWLAKP